jgi:predicted DCC family thiol-disulfide oxidoreductase YuxK
MTILLFDGTCGFCAKSVQFVLDRERRQSTLRFAALGSPTGVAIRQRHPALAGVDSMIWVEAAGATDERVFIRSAAALRVMRYLGGAWGVFAAIGGVIPRLVRDPIYDLIARHRHSLVGGGACLVPSPDQRARFIDWDATVSR